MVCPRTVVLSDTEFPVVVTYSVRFKLFFLLLIGHSAGFAQIMEKIWVPICLMSSACNHHISLLGPGALYHVKSIITITHAASTYDHHLALTYSSELAWTLNILSSLFHRHCRMLFSLYLRVDSIIRSDNSDNSDNSDIACINCVIVILSENSQ